MKKDSMEMIEQSNENSSSTSGNQKKGVDTEENQINTEKTSHDGELPENKKKKEKEKYG